MRGDIIVAAKQRKQNVLRSDIALLKVECLLPRLRNDPAGGGGEATNRRRRFQELADARPVLDH